MHRKINSKSKGTQYELKLIKELKELYETDDIHSTRNTNRKLDAEKVDIVLPQFHIQAKATETIPQVHNIFNDINREKTPVVFWKRNRKKEMVIIEKEEFYNLIKKLNEKQ